jgi:predicted dinucleotide-binding enzyme
LAGLTIGTTTSAAEQIAEVAVNARVIKAFNTTGSDNMLHSSYGGSRIFMPVCGDDVAAKNVVLALANLIGFDAMDVGPLTASRYLEPFAMLWIHMAYAVGFGRDFAFVLQKGH